MDSQAHLSIQALSAVGDLDFSSPLVKIRNVN